MDIIDYLTITPMDMLQPFYRQIIELEFSPT